MKTSSARIVALSLLLLAPLSSNGQSQGQRQTQSPTQGPTQGQPAAGDLQSDNQNADTAELVGSLWCDTADQLETVLRAHHIAKVPIRDALILINRGNPEACIPARAIVNEGPEIRRFTAGDAIFAVRSATVHGVMQGPYAVMMRPQTWYHANVVAELTPL